MSLTWCCVILFMVRYNQYLSVDETSARTQSHFIASSRMRRRNTMMSLAWCCVILFMIGIIALVIYLKVHCSLYPCCFALLLSPSVLWANES